MIHKIPEKHDAHTHMQIHIRVICCRCKCHITNVQHVKIQKWTFSTLKNRGRKGPKANSHDFQWGNVSWWSCSFQTSCSNWPTPIWPLKSPSAVRLGSWAPTAARKARRWRNAKSSMTRSAKKKRNCCTKFGNLGDVLENSDFCVDSLFEDPFKWISGHCWLCAHALEECTMGQKRSALPFHGRRWCHGSQRG